MSFRLLIECSKDLDSLQINFSDGTSVVQTCNDELDNSTGPILDSGIQNETTSHSRLRGDMLDLDADYSTVHQDVVPLPDVTIPDRPISVASDLQNLDI